MHHLNDVCPISHIPIEEISHPVTFVTEHRIVYNAEDVIGWLKHHSLINPITNAELNPDFANNILRPFNRNDSITPLVLRQAGYLDGAGGKVCSFFSFRTLWCNTLTTVTDTRRSGSVAEVHTDSKDTGWFICYHWGSWRFSFHLHFVYVLFVVSFDRASQKSMGRKQCSESRRVFHMDNRIWYCISSWMDRNTCVRTLHCPSFNHFHHIWLYGRCHGVFD